MFSEEPFKYRDAVLLNQEVLRRGHIGFHMPGHIGARFFDDNDCRRLIASDTTELSSTDDLHHPKGAALDSLEYAAEVFGSAYSFYLCSGATTGIRIMLSAVLDEESVLLLSRSVHMSVIWTLSILGCRYRFLPLRTSLSADLSPFVPVDPVVLEAVLETNPDITDFLVTSPDYYGNCADLAALSEISHRHGCRLLVDEAHGAHFAFGGDSFPRSAMKCGADISVQSLHKTLPALTPAAMIHVSGRAQASGYVSKSRIESGLCMYETSSPSFAIASSAELCITRMKELGSEVFEETADRVRRLIGELEDVNGILLPDRRAGMSRDPLRMTINTEGTGIGAPDIREALEKLGIYIEFSDPVRLVMIFSVLHKENEFRRLGEALKEMFSRPAENGLKYRDDLAKVSRSVSAAYAHLPEKAVDLRKAVYGRHRSSNYPIDDCAGRISAKPISFYPPGIPFLWPGETVSREIADLFAYADRSGIMSVGLSDGFFSALEPYSKQHPF